MASSLKIAGTLGYYAIFTEDFIENYCVNRAKPELHCDGKCALAQMLIKKAEKNKIPIDLEFLKSETLLFLTVQRGIDFLTFTVSDHVNTYYTNSYSFQLIDQLINPPRT
tara:strand:+ start:784 stop:1113 length:330 start_codon:yes stop_codon:yes gene_type:complete